MAAAGYVATNMGKTAELRLPAEREYIVVAKRAAAAIGSVAGFGVEAIDDLAIAVAQTFENAVSCLERSGALAGEVRFSFKVVTQGLEVTVKSSVSREAEVKARAREAEVLAARAQELQVRQAKELAAAHNLALQLMGLFVDASSYRVDERTGGLHVHLTKYLVS